jgi:hypothetical protein
MLFHEAGAPRRLETRSDIRTRFGDEPWNPTSSLAALYQQGFRQGRDDECSHSTIEAAVDGLPTKSTRLFARAPRERTHEKRASCGPLASLLSHSPHAPMRRRT